MSKLTEKLLRFWWFRFRNPVVRKGEKGGFKWKFRRFWLDIETVSGNFKARFTADVHPYGYLIAGQDAENIHGFCAAVYEVSHLLTTDQGFVNDIQKALKKYSTRIEKSEKIVEDETEEEIALENEKAVQEFVELPKKERRKAEKDIDRRFRKAVKKAGTDIEGEGGKTVIQ